MLEFFATTSDLPAREQVERFLGNESFFGPDLIRVPGLVDSVTASYAAG